jgi:integrase
MMQQGEVFKLASRRGGRERAEIEALAEPLGPRLGEMVVFAAATGMRPGEWVALEWRDIYRDGRVAYVRRSFSKGRLRCTKT